MAGKIVADTLEHSTAGSVTTDYVVNGSAKVWVQFDQGDNGVDGSLNVSSVTDNGTGDISDNFTNSFADDNYATCGFSGFNSVGGQNTWVSGHQNLPMTTWKQSGLLRAQASYANTARNSDVNDFSLMHFGDLA